MSETQSKPVAADAGQASSLPEIVPPEPDTAEQSNLFGADTSEQPNDDDLVFVGEVVLPGVGSFETGDMVPERIDQRQVAYLTANHLVRRLGDIIKEADERGLPSEQPAETPEQSDSGEPKPKPQRRKRQGKKSLL